MSAFDFCFGVVVGNEGGFTQNPSDPGNWTGGAVGAGVLRGTMFGISAAAYPALDIAGLTLDGARAIYLTDYWNRIAGDMLPGPVALLVFDGAVNQGVGRAARFMQEAVGATPDGVVGPLTVRAVQMRGDHPAAVVCEIAARRAVAYAGDDPGFWLGWYRRLERTLAAALAAQPADFQ